MTPALRERTVGDQNACVHCSSWDHTRHKMPGGVIAGEAKCRHKTGAGECGGKHGPWYHLGGVETATTGSIVGACGQDHDRMSGRKPGLYKVYSVPVLSIDGEEKAGTFLVDPGSDTNYICHDYVRRLGLQGVPYSCYLKVVDTEYVKKSSAKYKFDVMDRYGQVHHVSAVGLESITTLPDEPDLSPLSPLLSGQPSEILYRPRGTVDVLLGLESSILHRRTKYEWGNLRLLKSRFGCGWVLRGSHDSLSFPAVAVGPSPVDRGFGYHQGGPGSPRLLLHVSCGLQPWVRAVLRAKPTRHHPCACVHKVLGMLRLHLQEEKAVPP